MGNLRPPKIGVVWVQRSKMDIFGPKMGPGGRPEAARATKTLPFWCPVLTVTKWLKRGHFSHFGCVKNGTSESKFRDHFSIQTSPQNPQKDTSGTLIGLIFVHSAFFDILAPFSRLHGPFFSNHFPLMKNLTEIFETF